MMINSHGSEGLWGIVAAIDLHWRRIPDEIICNGLVVFYFDDLALCENALIK